MSLTQLMESWITTVHELVKEAPSVHPNALRASAVASVLRSAAATDLLDYDTRRDALYEAQRLLPVEEDVLIGAMFEGTEIVKWTQLRPRGPFEGPSIGGGWDEYHQVRAGTPLASFPQKVQDLIKQQLALDAQGPLGKREVVGYRASTLDETERDEDAD